MKIELLIHPQLKQQSTDRLKRIFKSSLLFYNFLSKSCIIRLCRLFRKEQILGTAAVQKTKFLGKSQSICLKLISDR